MLTRAANRRPDSLRPPWIEARFLLAALGFCLCLWLFFSVADEVSEQDFQATEERWMRALRRADDPGQPIGPLWFGEVARDVSALGGATVVVTISLLVCTHLLLRGLRRRALIVTATIAGGYLLSTALKASYARERPDIVPHLTHVSSASFPSGHSMASSIVYLTIGTLLADAATRRREKFFFIASAAILVLCIGASRVFLGVHYPSDVVAGWSAGTAWALASELIARHLQRRQNQTPSR